MKVRYSVDQGRKNIFIIRGWINQYFNGMSKKNKVPIKSISGSLSKDFIVQVKPIIRKNPIVFVIQTASNDFN